MTEFTEDDLNILLGATGKLRDVVNAFKIVSRRLKFCQQALDQTVPGVVETANSRIAYTTCKGWWLHGKMVGSLHTPRPVIDVKVVDCYPAYNEQRALWLFYWSSDSTGWGQATVPREWLNGIEYDKEDRQKLYHDDTAFHQGWSTAEKAILCLEMNMLQWARK